MSISVAGKQLLSFGRRLAHDEQGATLIYVSITLTVFMGFAALVIDGSRLFTLDTEMQSAADALALAGAAELDGNSDAITRATAAMDNLVKNYETFGDSETAITDYAAQYLDSLPAHDADEITAGNQTDEPAEARFVEVRLLQEDGDEDGPGEDNSRSVDTLFAPAIGGGDTVGAGATAVAGYTAAVCKFTPLFMCNPYDSPGEFLTKVGTPEERRRLIALKQSNGASAKYGPGNFGFLTHIGDTKSEKDNFKELLAKVDPGQCFRQTGVDTEPGNKVSARTALNTRFDLYDGNFNKHKNKAEYRPAENVTKGYVGNCANQKLESPPAMAFPLDSDTLTDPNRMGNGDWNDQFEKYWDINHPDGPEHELEWTNENPPSRYEVYQWEIDNEAIPNNSEAPANAENGNPQCNPDHPSDLDRRILYAAVIDCEAYGDLVKGRATDIPVLAFVKMFMTQPMNKKDTCGLSKDEDDEVVEGCNDTLYVEMVDKVQPGIDDEVLHDIVQLYR